MDRWMNGGYMDEWMDGWLVYILMVGGCMDVRWVYRYIDGGWRDG